MSQSPNARKRPAIERPISPPPTKRKGQASISKGAVASFFTPTSQKPKDRSAIWCERAPDDDTPATLLVGRYEPESMPESDRRKKRRKIAALDLDSTLIVPSSGKKFGNDPGDWRWWDSSVPGRLRQLYHEEEYRVVILSNQAGLILHPDPNSKGPKNTGKARVSSFKQKCSAVLTQLDIPTSVYAATGRDMYRKPRTDMWKEVCKDYDIPENEIDLDHSVFIGDAGGRTAQLKGSSGGGGGGSESKDFSCSDRNFAHNVGVAYKTPEEFFLGEEPRQFAREFDLATYPYPEPETEQKEILFEKLKSGQDVVLFVGPPGAGKSTFYWKHLEPLGYVRVNQDTLKSRAKCFKAAAELLLEGKSVVVDNTNPDPDGRQEWVELAQKHKMPIRCVWFKTSKALAEHNDIVRALNRTMNPEARAALPNLASNGYFSRLREPRVKEGFHDIVEVNFKFRGTKEEYAIWGRYWS